MRKALTLAEILIAVGVLVIACAMVFLIFANTIILNEYSRNNTIAMSHAEYIIEDIKNADFNGPPTLEDRINTNNEWDLNASDVTSEGLYALDNETIETSETSTDSNLLDVVVTVSWTSRGNVIRTVALETLISTP